MSKRGRVLLNWELFNRANYTDHRTILKLLRGMDHLSKLAHRGDMVALAVYVDLHSALPRLTRKQYEYLKLWMDGYTQEEIAGLVGIKREGVRNAIYRAARTISKYLEPR